MRPESNPTADTTPGLVLSLAEARQSFVMEDVTDQPRSLDRAFDLLVQGYLPLSTRKLDPAVVRADVCADAYQRNGLARTLMLTGRHPESGDREALGTMRLTAGTEQAADFGLPPLETMQLMAPAEGWEHFRFAGFDASQVAEGGRLVVSPSCRSGRSRESGFAAVVLRALVEGTFEFAVRHYGKTQLWGVLPYYVIERLESLGMRVMPAEAVVQRQEHAGLFNRYDRYWQQGRPLFCRVVVPSRQE